MLLSEKCAYILATIFYMAYI